VKRYFEIRNLKGSLKSVYDISIVMDVAFAYEHSAKPESNKERVILYNYSTISRTV
jgi:hypothetical protein